MNQTELATQLAEITTTVNRIGEETKTTLTKVTELETALANQDNVTAEVQAAFDALKAQVTVVDELIPNAPSA